MSATAECVADRRRARTTAAPRLFFVRDIIAAADAAGLQLAPGADAGELAAMLDRAFRSAAARRLLIASDAAAGTRKSWLRGLENDLVPIYCAAFGRSAASGEICDSPVSRWVKFLCCTAAPRTIGWCPDLIFHEITALSDRTISTYLRRAVTRLRRTGSAEFR